MMSPKRRREDQYISTAEREPKKRVQHRTVLALDGGTQRILVKDIAPMSDGRYKGVIYGFSPGFALEHQGMRVGEAILFDTDDVIG